eukprot:comp23191_c0_seq1/m.37620 comp23191_c0_seq1/g.37620  ORF comp23191_c0_seq1/g.37620 comp23191_c0_seq1/m.37620 type:complete len:278 (-) comp23191_c0_seq1:478-1311(-)
MECQRVSPRLRGLEPPSSLAQQAPQQQRTVFQLELESAPPAYGDVAMNSNEKEVGSAQAAAYIYAQPAPLYTSTPYDPMATPMAASSMQSCPPAFRPTTSFAPVSTGPYAPSATAPVSTIPSSLRMATRSPSSLQDGFKYTYADFLQAHGVSEATWQHFCKDVDAVVGEAPGKLVSFAAEFWAVNLVTLGTSHHLKRHMEKTVEEKLAEKIEEWNTHTFRPRGVVVEFQDDKFVTSRRRNHKHHQQNKTHDRYLVVRTLVAGTPVNFPPSPTSFQGM